MESWIKFRLLYDIFFAPALGGACAMGANTMALIQTCQIQAIMTVPHRLSLHGWQTAMVIIIIIISSSSISTFSLLHLSYNIHWAIALVVRSSSFLGWPWAHLALLPQQQKNTDVRCLLFPIAVGRLSLGKPATITFLRKQGCVIPRNLQQNPMKGPLNLRIW